MCVIEFIKIQTQNNCHETELNYKNNLSKILKSITNTTNTKGDRDEQTWRKLEGIDMIVIFWKLVSLTVYQS